ncbi:prolyl oligopeptidase family serine peptidase [candidate division KSB1 bacterium]
MFNFRNSRYSGLFCVIAIVVFFGFTVVLSVADSAYAQTKRPMKIEDIDKINRISGQQISDNGEWIGYIVKPGKGDGELTVMNLKNDKMFVVERGSNLQFSSDAKWAVYTILPHELSDEEKKAEEKAKEERRENDDEDPPAERNETELLNLSSGEKVLIDSVQSYIFSDDSKWLACTMIKRDTTRRGGRGRGGRSGTGPGARQRPQRGAGTGAGGEQQDREPKKATGNNLVLRDLKNGSEEQIRFVTSHTIMEDSKYMYYVVSSTDDEEDGLYVKNLGKNTPGNPILSGKGKYQGFVMNKKKDKMIFLTDRDDQDSKKPEFNIYMWDVGDIDAKKILDSSEIADFPEDMMLATSGMRFSKDAGSVFFNITERPEEEKENEEDEEEAASPVIVWHWKDVTIKSQEQARLTGKTTGSNHVQSGRGSRGADSGPTFQAVYHIVSQKFIRLTDEDMSSVQIGPHDKLAIGSDNKKYEEERPWSPTYRDYYIVDLEDGSRIPLETETRWSYDWSKDGQFLLQYVQPDWWVYDLKTGEKRNLTEKLNVAFWNTDDDHPNVKRAWGTTGWTKDDEGVLLNDKYDIWYFPIKKPGEPVSVTAGLGRRMDVQFRLYRDRSGGQAGGRFGRRSANDDEEPINLKETLRLSYSNNKTKAAGYYEVKLGNDPKKVFEVDRRIGSPQKAKEKDMYMFTMSNSMEYGDIYVSDKNFRDVRKVSEANPDNLGILWCKAQLIDYMNADGVPLQAILTLPEDYQEGKKYPMIIYFYERLTQGLHNYSIPSFGSGFSASWFASNGYVVLQPDIIYTDGFPGPSSVKCVVPAAQKVIDMGIADPKAIAITGHSWGGYQTAFIVTQTDMFACAYAGAPVSNMTSAYGGIRWGTGNPRTFQYETGQSRLGGSLWEYPERYIENSPLFFADRVNTPIMLLHGDEDTAVPWYQSIEYFLALRRLDKPCWFLQYLDEPHGLRDDVAKKDFFIRRNQFFDHYLKGAPMPKWMKEGVKVGEKGDVEY